MKGSLFRETRGADFLLFGFAYCNLNPVVPPSGLIYHVYMQQKSYSMSLLFLSVEPLAHAENLTLN
jgi:hypothetical protein